MESNNTKQFEILVVDPIVDESSAEKCALLLLSKEEKEYIEKEKFLKPYDKTLDVLTKLGAFTYDLLEEKNLHGKIQKIDYVANFVGAKTAKLYELYNP